MTHIFLSYSWAEPEPMLELAARLARRRYTLWWDARLLPRDIFGGAIAARIDAARAVIAVWPHASTGIEWIHHDAQRAHEQKKLVNVRAAGATGPIPPPFHDMAVLPAHDDGAIGAALAALGVVPEEAEALNDGRECNEAALVWDEIRERDDAKVFDLFYQRYGESYILYRRLAQRKIAELRPEGTPPLPAPSPLPAARDVLITVEAGMHTAIVNQVAAAAGGRVLLTGSDDRTARLWRAGGPEDPELPPPAFYGAPDRRELAAGPGSGEGGAGLRHVRTLRVPAGAANDGQIYAVALSPDGEVAAVGGYTRKLDHWVYVFETAGGRLITRLGQLGNAIFHLAFSASGRYLAAALGGGEGVRVWDARSWRPAGEDRDYGSATAHAVVFDENGWLYSAASDGFLRCYGLSRAIRLSASGSGTGLVLEGKMKTKGGTEPVSIALHPDGGKLAVGFHDTPAVDVYEAPGLTFLYAASTTGVDNGNLASVAWIRARERGPGAQHHLAAGGQYCDSGKFSLRIWERAGQGAFHDVPLTSGTLMHVLSTGGGLAFASQDPAFGVIGLHQEALWQGPVTADMRGKRGRHFMVSPDGRQVRFGLGFGGTTPVLFDAANVTLSDSPEPPANLSPPDTAGLKITNWQNDPAPAVDGRPLPLDQEEVCRSLAISGNGAFFVLGADRSLRAYGREGKPLWRKFAPGPAWGVNITADGRFVVATYGDGTVRWHRLGDGEEVLAFFILPADRRWVAWTPQGAFAASPGGADLIGWHVNRGYEEAPDFYPASLFRDFFCRPEAVSAALAPPLPRPVPPAQGGRGWLR